MIQKARSVFRRANALVLAPFLFSLSYQLLQSVFGNHSSISFWLFFGFIIVMFYAVSWFFIIATEEDKFELSVCALWFVCCVLFDLDFLTFTTIVAASVVWGINLVDLSVLACVHKVTRKSVPIT